MCRSPNGCALTFHRLAAVGPHVVTMCPSTQVPPQVPFSAPHPPAAPPYTRPAEGPRQTLRSTTVWLLPGDVSLAADHVTSLESVGGRVGGDSSSCSWDCCSVVADFVTAAPRSRVTAPPPRRPRARPAAGWGHSGSLAPGNLW